MTLRRFTSNTPRVRRWSRTARAVNPSAAVPNREMQQLEQDLPEALRRMGDYGHRASMTAIDLSRSALTQLHREIQTATELSTGVAHDPFLQGIRKYLHLLLDH